MLICFADDCVTGLVLWWFWLLSVALCGWVAWCAFCVACDSAFLRLVWVVVCGCVYGCLALWVVGFCGVILGAFGLYGFRNIVLVRCGLRFAFVAWCLRWWAWWFYWLRLLFGFFGFQVSGLILVWISY